MATASVTYAREMVARPASDEAPAPERKVATATTSFAADVGWAIAGIVAVIAAAFIADQIAGDDTFPLATLPPVAEGLTIFATFYVVAQAVERLLEPLSRILLTDDKAKKEAAETSVEAQNAVTSSPDDATTTEKVQAAADAKAELAAREQHRTILFWVIASIVGVAVSAGMKLYFLQRVGIQNSSRWWEVLATGLIIGAGTKPLHDLIEFISSKKTEASDAASGATGTP